MTARRFLPSLATAVFPIAALAITALAFTALAITTPAMAEELFVSINQPTGMEPVFGTVVVEAVVSGDAVASEVVLFVDGKARGRLSRAPYQWTVNVGQDNSEHQFKIVARTATGLEATTAITSPPFQIDEEFSVELQQLYVTASNGGHHRVLDLNEADFRVMDDGRQEKVITFARGDVSIAATLLIDSSESMKGERLQAALRGARAFVEGMNESDEAAVLLFSDQLLHSTPFTNDAAMLLDSLADVEASGNTSINDHLYLGMKLLDARQGRRVVVLFTDGADLHSVLDMEEVLWKARRSQSLIFWIRLQDHGGGSHTSFATAWRNAEFNRHELETLEKTVEQSGGRIAEINSVDQIEGAFRDILTELREQYVLGYYPSKVNNDGSWHDVKVRVGRSGVKIRTRGGYVD